MGIDKLIFFKYSIESNFLKDEKLKLFHVYISDKA